MPRCGRRRRCVRLFLPADRAARARGATSRSAYRGRPRRIRRAQANRQRCRHAASRRRNEVIYRSVVSHLDRGALHLEDRDELSRCAPNRRSSCLDRHSVPGIAGVDRNRLCETIRFTLGRGRLFRVMRGRRALLGGRARRFLYFENALRRDRQDNCGAARRQR